MKLKVQASAAMAASMLALTGIFAPDAVSVTHKSSAQLLGEPETVAIAPGSFEFRLPGEFLKNDYPVDAPLQTTAMRRGFAIMKYQVSAADYARCVADGACEAPDANAATAGDAMPVTGVSYRDATAYATWLTGTTLHTVSRLLTAWEERGLVKSGRQRVTVVEPHRLRLLAEGRADKT